MSRSRKEKLSIHKEGLPYVPAKWPSEEEFKAAFEKAALLRQRERALGYDEDEPLPFAPYQRRTRRFSEIRITAVSRIDVTDVA